MPSLNGKIAAARAAMEDLAAARPGNRPTVSLIGASSGGDARSWSQKLPPCTLFFSVTDGRRRARTIHVNARSFAEAWAQGEAGLRALCRDEGWDPEAALWLRVDLVDQVRVMSWQGLQQALLRVKRNYFRHGLALDAGFRQAFVEQELNANAMLYGGTATPHAVINTAHFQRYGCQRHGQDFALPQAGSDPVFLLGMAGVFCGDDGVAHTLVKQGPDVGRRQLGPLRPEDVLTLVTSAADHLTRQAQKNGRFIYGHFPCFDREIGTYNSLRHASTTYAMAEAWGVTRDPALLEAIESALNHLIDQLIIRRRLPNGREAAFVVDAGGEIKLGANAAAILALVQHAEVTGVHAYAWLMSLLAEGILFMQDAARGGFVHVLHADDLSVKEAHRIIYYDGEAAFALCRLYAFDGEPRWLHAVEKAFGHFIEAEHWRAHDHWLAYAVNELTKYRPEEKYFRFGIRNVADHLDFVLKRQTTFPTLLELMLAARRMLDRIEALPALHHLLEDIDHDKFQQALTHRAHHLLNGFFWPEMAMFFKRPEAVVGSFFIRHQAFRVRIDDVEHYLSGYVAYYQWLKGQGGKNAAAVGTADRLTEEFV